MFLFFWEKTNKLDTLQMLGHQPDVSWTRQQTNQNCQLQTIFIGLQQDWTSHLKILIDYRRTFSDCIFSTVYNRPAFLLNHTLYASDESSSSLLPTLVCRIVAQLQNKQRRRTKVKTIGATSRHNCKHIEAWHGPQGSKNYQKNQKPQGTIIRQIRVDNLNNFQLYFFCERHFY